MRNNLYFKEMLLDMGIASTRVDSLAQATDDLHSAISRLDDHNYKLFVSNFYKTITLIDTFGEREKVKRFYHVKGLQNEEL
jgi:hypothetical protein